MTDHLARLVEVQPVSEQPIALIDGPDGAARKARVNRRGNLVPDGASGLVPHLETVPPRPQGQLNVLPAKGCKVFIEAAERHKLRAIEERGSTAREQSQEWGREIPGLWRNEIAAVNGQETAAKFTNLPGAAKHAGPVIVDLAGHTENRRVSEVCGQRRQGGPIKSHIVIEKINQSVLGCPYAPVGRRRKSLAALA